MTVSIKSIPVVDIHADNFFEYWPALTLAIHSATFIALDLEMSGIGNRKDTMTRSTEDRYKAFCEIARTRSVLSVGISVFQKTKTDSKSDDTSEDTNCAENINIKNTNFMVQTFNVMVLSNNNFVVEPGSLKFLVEHGFDFNKHYSMGIPYNRNDPKVNKEHPAYTISNLFFEILRASKPIVVHNGVLDLVFLYQNFYADLPSSSLSFLADLSEMFSAGIFDTKFIAEFHTHYSATFLNYIFKKNWRLNLKDEADMKSSVSIECFSYPSTADVYYNEIVNTSCQSSASLMPCEQYAAHGHCPKGMKCELSHDLDVILNYEEQKKERRKNRKRKRKEKEKSPGQSNTEYLFQENDTPADLSTNHTNTASGNHRAGFDAFMTGFCMATFFHRFRKPHVTSLAENLSEFVNKLNLSGKDVPLKVTKSQYCKTSASHNETWKKVISS